MRVRLTPAAEADVAEAATWYYERSPDVGEAFIRALDAALTLIGNSPNAFPTCHRSLQRALLRRFPYAVFFEVEGDVVTVMAVMPCARDPTRWRRRASS